MWGVGLGVNDVSIVGEPVAYGAGFIALLFVGFSTYIARYFYYYAAAGGPLLTRVGLAQPIYGFWLYGGSAPALVRLIERPDRTGVRDVRR